MEDRLPANYSMLLSGPPGVGKFEYLIARIREVLRSGERVVFVTLDMPPNEIRARAKALHLDLDTAEGKTFVFVDCYSATSSERPESAPGKKTFLVSSFSNLEGIGMAMSKAAQELGTPVRIYFYTVSTLLLHTPPQAIAKFFQIVTARVKSNLGFILYAVQEGVHEQMTMNLLARSWTASWRCASPTRWAPRCASTTCEATRSTPPGTRSCSSRRRWSGYDAGPAARHHSAREDRNPSPRRSAPRRVPAPLDAPPVQRQADGKAPVRREFCDPRREGRGNVALRGLLPCPAARARGAETLRPLGLGAARPRRRDVVPAAAPEPGATPYRRHRQPREYPHDDHRCHGGGTSRADRRRLDGIPDGPLPEGGRPPAVARADRRRAGDRRRDLFPVHQLDPDGAGPRGDPGDVRLRGRVPVLGPRRDHPELDADLTNGLGRDSDELDPVRVQGPRRAHRVLPANPRDGTVQRGEIDGRQGAVREIDQHRPDGDHGRIRLRKRERHRDRSGDFRDTGPRTIRIHLQDLRPGGERGPPRRRREPSGRTREGQTNARPGRSSDPVRHPRQQERFGGRAGAGRDRAPDGPAPRRYRDPHRGDGEQGRAGRPPDPRRDDHRGAVMLADVTRRLQGILAELRRLPAVLGATVARRDGILIAPVLPKTMDPKKIAAMAAAIVGTSEMAVVEMGLGSFNSSIVDTPIGKMISTGAGEEAILVTMVRNEANMGLVLLSVDKAVQSIAAILKTEEVSA